MSDGRALTLERHADHHRERYHQGEAPQAEVWEPVRKIQIYDPDIAREDAENWAFWLQAWGEE